MKTTFRSAHNGKSQKFSGVRKIGLAAKDGFYEVAVCGVSEDLTTVHVEVFNVN